MHACVCAFMCACMHICIRACMHACVRACVCVCVHVCIRACMRACMRVCVCVCVRACLHARVRACVRVCTTVMCICKCACFAVYVGSTAHTSTHAQCTFTSSTCRPGCRINSALHPDPIALTQPLADRVHCVPYLRACALQHHHHSTNCATAKLCSVNLPTYRRPAGVRAAAQRHARGAPAHRARPPPASVPAQRAEPGGGVRAGMRPANGARDHPSQHCQWLAACLLAPLPSCVCAARLMDWSGVRAVFAALRAVRARALLHHRQTHGLAFRVRLACFRADGALAAAAAPCAASGGGCCGL